MVTLDTQLPEFGFPQQYDSIVFSADDPCVITIECGEDQIKLNLTPDNKGKIHTDEFLCAKIGGLCPLLERQEML